MVVVFLQDFHVVYEINIGVVTVSDAVDGNLEDLWTESFHIDHLR
jgi:hypothetical protein